jgi:hypothetical protein
MGVIKMSNCNGVNYLFDVLFHEVMETHPIVRERLNAKLAQVYARCTLSQQESLDEVFNELCHRSFSQCFNLSTHEILDAKKMMLPAKHSSRMPCHP